MEKEENADAQCIGNLEHHLHQLFSSVRVPGDDFVYSASQDMYSVLDEYCDETAFHESRPPLLILDESGSGKSALLSNWLQKKYQKLAQGRKGDEFIFWHAVGCSRQSMNVNSLIRRLMYDLKNRFDLVRDVPMAQDRLSWELPRFFEMASKRGRLIIMIDGIHRLVNNDDSEAGLAWLPLDFPPNVRIILTATDSEQLNKVPIVENSVIVPLNRSQSNGSSSGAAAPLNRSHSNGGSSGAEINASETTGYTRPPYAGDEDLDEQGSAGAGSNWRHTSTSALPKGSKILAELRRRKWRHVRVKRMDRGQCRTAVETYIWKSVQRETMEFATGPFLTHIPEDSVAKEVPPLDSAPGYLLFDTQVAKLLTHALGGTPMFIRLILQCSHYAVKRGFSLWFVWDDWLRAESVSALVTRILVTIEQGHQPTAESRAEDKRRTEEAGALQALRILYPWHPSFQDSEETFDDAELDDMEHIAAITTKKVTTTDDGEEEANMTLSNKVNENLGDQQWLALGGFAEAVLKRTRGQINEALASTMQQAQAMAAMDFQAKHSHAIAKAAAAAAVTSSKSNIVSLASMSLLIPDEEANCGAIDILEASIKLSRQISQVQANLVQHQDQFGSESKDDEEAAAAAAAIAAALAVSAADLSIAGNDLHKAESKGKAVEPAAVQQQRNEQVPAAAAAAAVGIGTLPSYLLGGTQVSGLGNILGNALALLYVARHGLKESEIWGLLASMHRMERQAQMDKINETSFGPGHSFVGPDNGETQAIVQICYTARGMLDDLCKAEDLTHSGLVTRGMLTKVLHKLHPGLTFTDMLRLLDITSLHEDDPTQLSEDILVNYTELLRRVTIVYEKKRHKGDASISTFESITKAAKDNLDQLPVFGKKKDKKENFAAHLFREDGGADSADAGGDLDLFETLGPVLEESLLQVLIALGVLHSPENHVLVLPSDNDTLRQVIYSRYVEARGGDAVWHGHLIRHFQKERNSMRRCEELPWHLQLCRKWSAMKDALVDLSTFEMMYDSSDLRDEYMSYWVQLTEGPMYITNELHKMAAVTQQRQVEEVLRGDRGRDPELAKVLIQLDTAVALNLTEKNAKKLLLQNQVSPFDVIEEFNKSMELWVAHQKPSVTSINTKILHIARFLAEFSSKGAAQPPFVRLPVDMRSLELFEIPIDSYKSVVPDDIADEPNKQFAIENGQDGQESGEEVAAKKAIEFFPAPRHLKGGNIYFYLRWMWIQFPWMALNNTVEVGSVCDVGGLASVIAAYAAGARGRGRAGPTVVSKGVHDELNFEDEAAVAVAAGVQHLSAKGQKDLAIARSTRLWDVKKNDPSKPVFENTVSRKNAFVKSILVPSKVQDVMDMNIRKVRDDIANSNAAKHKMPPKFRRSMEQELEAMKGIPHSQHCKRSMTRNTLFPSLDAHIKEKNREIEDDPELYANALATMRLGGPGLPLQAGLEDDIKKLAEQEQMEAWNQRRGGALPVGSERELEFEREFERMVRLRSLANKTTTLLRERITLCDGLRHECESRDVQDDEIQQFMYSGEEAIKQLKEKYQTMSDALDEGKRLNNGYKLLIEMLMFNPPFNESHVLQQQAQVVLAKQQLSDVQKLRHNMYMQAEREALVKQKQVHMKITYFREARNNIRKKIVQMFPSHVESGPSVEIKQDSTSTEDKVRKSRNAILVSKESVDAATITAAIEKGVNLSQISASDQAAEVSKEITNMSEAAAGEALGDILTSVQNKAKKESVKDRAKRLKKEREEKERESEEFKFDKDSLTSAVINAIFKSDSEKSAEMSAKAKIRQTTMMWEYVMEKTGSTNEDELVERFQDAKKLSDSLLAQQNLVDSRLAQLRTEHDEVKQQLSQSILMGGEEDSTEAAAAPPPVSDPDVIPENMNDPRFIENKLQATEMRLAQIQRQVELSINKINEVRTGVGHIMNLLAVNARMLHNLPKSLPPSVKSGDDVAACISWCEERILAINEAQMVDSSKPSAAASGNDDSKPLFVRQTDLAVAIQKMIDHSNGGGPNPSRRKGAATKRAGKVSGGMGASIVMSNTDGFEVVNSPKQVVVPASFDVDTRNDQEVDRIQKFRDQESEKFEAQQLEAKMDGSGAGVQKFLTEALATKESQFLLRKTNLSSDLRKGRNAGYGYVLDDFLEKAGLPIRLGSNAPPVKVDTADEDQEQEHKKKTKKKPSTPKVKELDVVAIEDD